MTFFSKLSQNKDKKRRFPFLQIILFALFLLLSTKGTINAESWITTTIDSEGEVGENTSIAVDLNNNYLISYIDHTNGALKFAKYDGNTWTTTTVDPTCGAYYDAQDTSITVDDDNNYLISYYDSNNQDLKFAKYDGNSWSTTTIDSTGNVGLLPDITTTSDINDYYLISYLDYTNGDLKLAKYDGNTWTTSIIDSSGYVGKYSSITTDEDNNYLVSYSDSSNYDLKFAKYDGDSWAITVVDNDTPGYVGWDTSIATDNDNNYLISYIHNTGAYSSVLKLAKYNGTSWSIEGIDDQSMARYSSLTVDQENNYLVSYTNFRDGYLNVAKYNGTTWTITGIDAMCTEGLDSSIAVDMNNKYLISYQSYYGYSDTDLKFAIIGTNTTAPYISLTPLSPDPNIDRSPSFAGLAEEDGSPIVSVQYQIDTTSGTWQSCTSDDGTFDEIEETFLCTVSLPLNYGQHTIYIRATNSDGATTTAGNEITDTFFTNPFLYPWTSSISTVDSTGDVGLYTSITTDKENNFLVSYYKHTEFDFGSFESTHLYELQFAKHNGESWSTSSLGIVSSPPFEEQDIMQSSITTDVNNNYLISFAGEAFPGYDNLNLAKYDGNSWTTTTVDSSGNVGRYSSITTDSNNNYLISYYDADNSCLKFAKFNGETWEISTIDNSVGVGYYTSITTDSDDNYLIAYHDSANGYLKFAMYNGTSWDITTVDSGPNAGQYPSLTTDLDDNYLISYYSGNPDYDLKFAKYDGESWQISTVDSVGYIGEYTSITVDQENNYLISYYDSDSAGLKMAKYDGTQWSKILIDSLLDVGKYSSITTDSDNNYAISYYDSSGGNLKSAILTTDNQAPTISLTPLSDPHSNSKPTLSGKAVDTVGYISSVQYQVDTTNLIWSNCTASDGSFTYEYEEDFNCKISTPLSEGTHTIYIRATDSNGHTTPLNEYSLDTFLVDTTNPSLSLLEIDNYPFVTSTRWVVNPKPIFEGTVEQGSTLKVSIPSINISNITIPSSNGNWQWQTSSNLPLGTHTVSFTAMDLAGNIKTVIATIVKVESFSPPEADTIEEDTDEESPLQEEAIEPTVPEEPTTNIQVVRFLDDKGNPLENAVVEINEKKYYTNDKGEIEVSGLEKGKVYETKVEHNGVIYKKEVLGAEDEQIVELKTDYPLNKILLYSGGILFLIIGIILISHSKKTKSF